MSNHYGSLYTCSYNTACGKNLLQGQLPALANHSFVILHARLAGVLAAAAPFSAMAAFQAPLEAALMDKQLDADRPATFAAVESLFGLIASGVVFEGGEGVCSKIMSAAIQLVIVKSLYEESYILKAIINGLCCESLRRP